MIKSIYGNFLRGEVYLKGDKSISHRALILAAISSGNSCIKNISFCEDVRHTASALEQLGASIRLISKNSKHYCIVQSIGPRILLQPDKSLFLGNSGTGARLLLGLVSSHDIQVGLDGDTSLRARSMARVIEPLKLMGAQFNNDHLPLYSNGNPYPVPITYKMKHPSAQIKTAIMLAALNSYGETTIYEKFPTRDHSERIFPLFGANISIEQAEQKIIKIKPNYNMQGCYMEISGDFSSAAFLIVAALITQNSYIELKNINVNPTRTGILDCLLKMGANITLINKREVSNEPVADIIVKSSKLKAIHIKPEIAPRMIDEYPILAVAAALAEGTSKFEGVAELRLKESNRLNTIITALKANNINCYSKKDDIYIEGANEKEFGGGYVKTNMDHRIAMSFLILGLVSPKPITIDDSKIINSSFPEFFAVMQQLGIKIRY